MTVAKEGGGTKSGRVCSPKRRTDRQSHLERWKQRRENGQGEEGPRRAEGQRGKAKGQEGA